MPRVSNNGEKGNFTCWSLCALSPKSTRSTAFIALENKIIGLSSQLKEHGDIKDILHSQSVACSKAMQ